MLTAAILALYLIYVAVAVQRGVTTWLDHAVQCSVTLSQGVNRWLLFGHPDETVSARCHRLQHSSRAWALARRVFNTIFFWQDDHCADSYADDVARAAQVLGWHRHPGPPPDIDRIDV